MRAKTVSLRTEKKKVKSRENFGGFSLFLMQSSCVSPSSLLTHEGMGRGGDKLYDRGLQCFKLNGNQTENERYWQKNNSLLFAQCLKMYSFFRICI
jgi:hypothetical protein